jgi:transcriptional repressor NrdR
MPMVVKRDGRREPFNRSKIMMGLRKACEKRPISIDHLERIANRIEQEIQERGEREVKSTLIGERVINELRSVDGVAYVRFASVYRQFKDINEFVDELKELLGNRATERRENREREKEKGGVPSVRRKR